MIGLNAYTFWFKTIISRQRNSELCCYRKISDSVYLRGGPKVLCNSVPECPFKVRPPSVSVRLLLVHSNYILTYLLNCSFVYIVAFAFNLSCHHHSYNGSK